MFFWILKAELEFVGQINTKEENSRRRKCRKGLDESLQPAVQRCWSRGLRYTGALMRLERCGFGL